MGLPKKSNIKKNIPLTEEKTLLPRRYELLDKINKDGTYLPKSLLHADLDKGFLDFVKNELKTVIEGIHQINDGVSNTAVSAKLKFKF